MTTAPCMKCNKAMTGECRAEHKQSCDVYMEYWHRCRKESKDRILKRGADEMYLESVTKAMRNNKKGKRVGFR